MIRSVAQPGVIDGHRAAAQFPVGVVCGVMLDGGAMDFAPERFRQRVVSRIHVAELGVGALAIRRYFQRMQHAHAGNHFPERIVAVPDDFAVAQFADGNTIDPDIGDHGDFGVRIAVRDMLRGYRGQFEFTETPRDLDHVGVAQLLATQQQQ